jgi:membrane fusion protein
MQPSSAENLFRKQAIDALSKRPFGRPIAVFPRPWSWLTALVLCLVAVSAGFLATAEYSRKESVRGWLVARDGVTKVSHDSAATVIELVRAPGDSVTAGEPILVLGRNHFLEDGSDSGKSQLRELQDQATSIDRQMHILETEAAIERESITAQLGSLEAEQRGASESQQRQRQRIAVAAQKLSRLAAAVNSGGVSQWEVIKQQDELSSLQQALTAMRQDAAARQRERQRLRERGERLPLDTERLMTELRLRRSNLQQQLTERRAARRIVVVAPVAGKLSSFAVRAGDSIAPRQLLATILPQELSLTAEVYVPSSAIGFVQPGQAVRLLFDAFPSQRFGAFPGQVSDVADFVLLPDEVPNTFQPREAVFKVTVELAQTDFKLPTGVIRLRPGMLLVADFILETRTLATWLLAPLRWQDRENAVGSTSGRTRTVH